MIKKRLFLIIRGAVQGVGFRPFIYRIATELGLNGWVNNSCQGVFLEVEGEEYLLNNFLERVKNEHPPLSKIQSLESQWLEVLGYNSFEIKHSVSGEKTAVVLPDISTCRECLQEIFNPHNRRYYYPFTNCTNCGPRYSIINTLPYDRCHTTMKFFPMCSDCEAEYNNPLDRRFHAQPNACAQCGPQLQLWDKNGEIIATENQALLNTVTAIREGKIIAIKGLGGFQLVVDAYNTNAVQELRKRKQRPDKPFAVMYPSLELVKQECEVTLIEEQLLLSPESPIVLLKKRTSFTTKKDEQEIAYQQNTSPQLTDKRSKQKNISKLIAANNPYLGVMLPYTPLHHLLMAELGTAIIATSGNLSDEPICIDENEALQRLNQIADLLLIHNRAIARPVDDSVVRVMNNREMVIRRARGYAPFPITLRDSFFHKNTKIKLSLAVGGHLKNTIAIANNQQIFMSQHIGDLDNVAAFNCFQQVMTSLAEIYDFEPEQIVCDAHPDYISSQFAQSQGLPVIKVQHHYAHILACMAENNLEAPVLGVAWDGTGYGDDNTIWGGELIYITPKNYERVAHFRPWRLPGGEKAVKEPRRVALGLLYELYFTNQMPSLFPPYILTNMGFTPQNLSLVQTMLKSGLNSPLTSSLGRFFDGVASLLNVRQQVSFEGQAAMELEFAIADTITDEYYPFTLSSSVPIIIDWSSIIKEILNDHHANLPINIISARFHNTLVEIIVKIAHHIGEKRIVLTGGCFQNRYLTERTIKRLQSEQFIPYWHQKIPPNDGGIALGQIMATIISN
jgi:hydrogenase maturation protein HypF